MEKSAISGITRFEIGQDAAQNEQLDDGVRPLLDTDPTIAADEEQARGGSGRDPDSPVAVRSVRLSDLGALRSIRSFVRLNQPDALLAPNGPVRGGVASLIPWSNPRPHVFVATVESRIAGVAVFDSVLPDQRWVLTGVGCIDSIADPLAVVERLVAGAVVAAGSQGVKRLLARVDERSELNDVLRAVAFAPYASETVLAARNLRGLSPVSALRKQDAADTWAIHQLYNAAAPRLVQYAEAYTSHRWDLDPKRRRERLGGGSGWLIEEGHHVVGYARIIARGDCRVVELVFHPERQDVLDSLVEGALARIGSSGGGKVYCAVRGYQSEAIAPLERRGFTPILEQNLYIKYTTANVRLPAFETVPLHVDVREKLPKRVPTFMRRQSSDESAN